MLTANEIQQRPVAVVGLGQIGMSWAAYFAARGLMVHATDPHPDAAPRTQSYVREVWPQLVELGLVVPSASPDNVVFFEGTAQAVAGCGWVQENAPENEALKIELLATIDAVVGPEVVIASSTSALSMSMMQSGCAHPQRCVTAHPFNPPHLIPLVELVGGKATASQALDVAASFYRAIGREPIRLQREIYGHVANRLQYVLFNEAAQLVLEGVATVEDIDKAVTWGPGMRWPVVGPFMTFHMAGGDAGMAGALAKFAPRDKLVSDRSKRLNLAGEQREQLHDGACAAQGGLSIRELEKHRDRLLVELLKAKKALASTHDGL